MGGLERIAIAPEEAIETFIIDWPVLVFIGLFFGAFAGEDQPWRSRAFKAGCIAAVVFSAIAFISYVVAPDWMWMYFIDPDAVAWTLPLIALGYLATFGLGFAAALGLKLLSLTYVVAAAFAAIVAEVVVVAMTWDRYRSVGTTQQWLSDEAASLLTLSPEGPVRVISAFGPIFVAVFVVVFIWTLRGRRAAATDR